MSITECIVVMQDDRRGESSRRHRLATIAPKDDQTSSTSSSRSGRMNAPSITPSRQRLPPRSRTGCWTCRTRKVKCDEGKPLCGQCSRLGHTCDYNPRISWRDDTLRVIERMQDLTTEGSFIWDRVASPAPSSAGSIIDDLAPFATLLTDEDRERKAEASIPGTFNVIVNPDSFQHLAEYAWDDNDCKKNGLSSLRRGSIAASLASSVGRDSLIEAVALPNDPNVVILPRFEDLSKRSTRELKTPNSPLLSIYPNIKREDSDSGYFSRSPETTNILKYFRDVVWKQLIPPENEPGSSITILDEAAAQFPPLIRAMMAVGSLAMFQQDRKERLDSLQHYSATLPELQNSLRSDEDLASDGAFLTHFLMLIYETATANNEHPHIWQHHISTLLKITLLRQRLYGGERFPFIVWWACNIDLDALMSGLGSGDFVGHMLKNDLIPPPSFHLYPLGSDGSSVVYPEEREALPIVLQLDYEVTLHAIRLGLLAAEFRDDRALETTDPRQKAIALKMRQSRTSEIQEGLRHLWTVPAVQEIGQIQLPTRAQRLFHHAWTLYRACIIYSHTSMWPSQRMDTSPDYDDEIDAAAQQITQVAQAIADTEPYAAHYLIFPLFMAGFASTMGNQKMLVLDLIQRMEERDIGRNTRASRKALEAVYEQQNDRFMHTGQSLDVNWFQVMVDRGLTVVNFGL